jgi:hypothetical protein
MMEKASCPVVSRVTASSSKGDLELSTAGLKIPAPGGAIFLLEVLLNVAHHLLDIDHGFVVGSWIIC